MLEFLKRNKPLKSGSRALYRRTNEVVEIKEHKLPNQVTILIPINSRIYNEDFKYLAFVENDINRLKSSILEVTISIDMLEVLPDKEIAELLY